MTSKFALLFLVLSAIALSPFLLCYPPPLADYVNHLARAHIIANIAESPYLARYYEIDWSPIPNLAVDIAVPLLARFMPLEIAHLLFLLFAMLLVASGAIAVNLALFRRLSILPFGVFLLLYNRHLLWGFINYVFGVGLALWIFVAWITLREQRPALRFALFSVLSTALFIAHLHALGCYAVLVVTYETAARWQTLRTNTRQFTTGLAVTLSQFAFPAILLLLFSKTRERAGDTRFSTVWSKLAGSFDVFNNYDHALDFATMLILCGLFLAALARRKIRVHPRMVLPLLTLTLVYLLLPYRIFGSIGADRRLTMFIAVIFVASLEWGAREIRWRIILGTAMLGFFVVRMGVIAVQWHRADDVYQSLISAIDLIGTGDRLAVFAGDPSQVPYLRNPPVDHIANIAVVHRDAFVNSLFADEGNQVLRVRYNTDTAFFKCPSQTYRVLPSNGGWGKADVFSSFPWDRFDYLLIIHARFFAGEPPPFVKQLWRDEEIDSTLLQIRQ